MQPRLMTFPKSQFRTQQRAFSATLYNKYNFLEYSVKSDSIFCHPCRLWVSKFGYQEEAFTMRGFCNWKKPELIQKHIESQFHKRSVIARRALHASRTGRSVIEQVCRHHACIVRTNREYLKSLCRIVLYLGGQTIAILLAFDQPRQLFTAYPINDTRVK